MTHIITSPETQTLATNASALGNFESEHVQWTPEEFGHLNHKCLKIIGLDYKISHQVVYFFLLGIHIFKL